MGLIVLAPRPLAPGIKLVRRLCEASLAGPNSLFRALAGDKESFSILVLWRAVNDGAINDEVLSLPDLSVLGGPIDVMAVAVAVRL